MTTDLQEQCELGQQQLTRMEYLEAETTLAEAEERAWAAKDFDTLARLYMPLQEARRQRRQRCGEGAVVLDLIAAGPQDHVDGKRVIENYPHGQLLVAGWGTIEPAVTVRRLAREHRLYVETFLGAVFPSDEGPVVVIAALEEIQLPEIETNWRELEDMLVRALGIDIYPAEILPKGSRKGDTSTYAEVMAMWERLHAPFLAAAQMQVDPIQKIEAYRRTQRVDYGCELAHQQAAEVARELARRR